jgi:uncharacterized protein YdaU (DUF1376 family)
MHYYQFNIGDYLSHTKHLSPMEDICYRRLLDFYYLHEQPIPNDLPKITRLLCLNKEYLTDVEQVLNEFFKLTDNGWINERADKEIKQYQSFKIAGAAGAAKRWAKGNNKDVIGGASGGHVNPNAKHKTLNNKHKPLNNNQVKYIPPIPAELLSDYLKLRKAKKAGELTETAFKQIEKQAQKSNITTVQAIEMCCLRGWVGFKADWLIQKANREEGRQNAAMSIFKPENTKHLQGNNLKLVEDI